MYSKLLNFANLFVSWQLKLHKTLIGRQVAGTIGHGTPYIFKEGKIRYNRRNLGNLVNNYRYHNHGNLVNNYIEYHRELNRLSIYKSLFTKELWRLVNTHCHMVCSSTYIWYAVAHIILNSSSYKILRYHETF